jgi:hypothetical protein
LVATSYLWPYIQNFLRYLKLQPINLKGGFSI